jgi:hypothetical protein
VFNILRKFQDIISTIEVIKHEIEENQIRTYLKLELTDGSQLIIKDYKFIDNKRKYAYHWMDGDGNLRIRWDNTEHWKMISTFPHHKHVGNDENVAASIETDIESVLTCIRDHIRNK